MLMLNICSVNVHIVSGPSCEPSPYVFYTYLFSADHSLNKTGLENLE